MKYLIYIFLISVLSMFVIADIDLNEIRMEGDSICLPSNNNCGFFEQIEKECELTGYAPLQWYGDDFWDLYNVNNYGFASPIECNDLFYYEYGCINQESIYIATDYFKLGNYYYADVESVLRCENGCNEQLGKCYGTPETNNVPNTPLCSFGSEKCYKGDVYECQGQDWTLKDNCGFFEGCKEINYDYARCNSEIDYQSQDAKWCQYNTNDNLNGVCFEAGSSGCPSNAVGYNMEPSDCVSYVCKSRFDCGNFISNTCEDNKCTRGFFGGIIDWMMLNLTMVLVIVGGLLFIRFAVPMVKGIGGAIVLGVIALLIYLIAFQDMSPILKLFSWLSFG